MKRKLIFYPALLLAALFLSIGAFGQNNNASPGDDEKKPTVRIGLANVKTGKVGAGVNAFELAGAIQISLVQYVKGTKIEIVPLEARLAGAIEEEARQKECAYILYATVSHKKGGGGMAMFRKIVPVVGMVVPVVGVAGMIAGTAATTAISAATAGVKPKDELTLDVELKNGSTVALTKQFKSKAKSAGEDVISPLVEQAAIALVETVGK